MTEIVTLTMNPSIDINTTIDKVMVDKKLRCSKPRYEPGGGGINVSRALRKLGGTSLPVYPSGGPPGLLLKSLLEKEGIQGNEISFNKWTRESFIVYEESSDSQYRFNPPGPEMEKKDWKDCIDYVFNISPSPRYLVASGGLPPGVPQDFYARLARMARKRDIKMILDTSGEALPPAVKEGVFMFKPNWREFNTLFGDKEDIDPAEEATKLVKDKKIQVVVISLGAGGAIVVQEKGCERLHPPPVSVKSRVGAGDSMVAGIVCGLARGKSISDSAVFGVAAGAAAVMTEGTELCRREDTEKIYKKMVSEKI